MKNKILLLLFMVLYVRVCAQDSAEKWKPFFAGVTLGTVPVNSINGIDTGFSNAFSVAPYLAIRNRSGWGIRYSPRILAGGSKPGIYLHELSAGVSQYDKKAVNYELEYSHYFFTNNAGIPYTPLNNEVYGSFAYKKTWLMPTITAGIGFGTDTTGGISNPAYDYGFSAGVSHNFTWDGDEISYSFSPRVMVNAGTNQYFSFMHFNKYISNSKQFVNFVKTTPGKSAGNSAGRGYGSGGGGGITTTTATTTTTTATEKFALSNFEFGMESELDIGDIAVRPDASLYIPAGSEAGNKVFGYWQIVIEYRF
jgi:hypothetical protein